MGLSARYFGRGLVAAAALGLGIAATHSGAAVRTLSQIEGPTVVGVPTADSPEVIDIKGTRTPPRPPVRPPTRSPVRP